MCNQDRVAKDQGFDGAETEQATEWKSVFLSQLGSQTLRGQWVIKLAIFVPGYKNFRL